MGDTTEFLMAYKRFKDQVEMKETKDLPDLERLIYTLLVGIPDVPADHERGEDAPLDAIDQRVAILKAVFVEANRFKEDEFLDTGLLIYDKAGELAKQMIMESGALEVHLGKIQKPARGY
jgi:hypothetical protein